MAKYKRKNNYARKRKSSRKVLKVVVTIALLLFAGVVFALSPACNISKVLVQGNQTLPSKSIVQTVDLPIGDNVFYSVNGSIFDKIFMTWKTYKDKLMSKYVVIKSADFAFTLGGQVTIKIIERVPFIYIPMGEKFALVDEDGVIINIVKIKPDDGKLILKGIKFKGEKVGEKMGFAHNEGVPKVLRLFKLFEKPDQIPKQLVSMIVAFDVSNPNNVAIDLIGNRKVLIGDTNSLGDPDLTYKLTFINSIMEKIKAGDEGVLDYSSTRDPVWSKKN